MNLMDRLYAVKQHGQASVEDVQLVAADACTEIEQLRAKIERMESALQAALLFHQRQPFPYRHDNQIAAIIAALND